jgi:RimJ/RimL family protein N-acetyltransferase
MLPQKGALGHAAISQDRTMDPTTDTQVRLPAGPVTLRPFRTDDVDDIVTGCNDPLVQRFTPVPGPYTREHAVEFLTTRVPEDRAAGGIQLAIADPASDRLLGAVGIQRVQDTSAEIGYWVAPWGRRRGAATAATRALTEWAFQGRFTRLELRTELENGASQRVAGNAGYTRDGVLRGAGVRDGSRVDLVCFTRLAGDLPGPVPRPLPDLPGGRLTDGVVTLRPVGPADAGDLVALRSLADVYASMVPPAPPDPVAVARTCAHAEARWLEGTRAWMCVRDAATDAFAGELGLHVTDPVSGEAMAGYIVTPAWRGRGYARRALRLAAGWAFARAGVARLTAGTVPGNAASRRVLEAAGFTREGSQRARLVGPGGTRQDTLLYSLLPGDPR